MPTLKPKVFVGSSSEAREIARGFCKALSDDAAMIPWWHAMDFKPMKSTLDGLWEATIRYDFGLFILTPDDHIESRGQENYSARDNVLFELGLFLGRLGPDRTFAVIQRGIDPNKQVKVLSDLAGYLIPSFTQGDEYELMASIDNAVFGIRRLIQEQKRMRRHFKLSRSQKYDDVKKVFTMTLSGARIIQHKAELKGKKLVVIVKKRDRIIHFEDDTYIARGIPRAPSGIDPDDLILTTHAKDVLANVERGDIIEGHLLLIPEDFDVRNAQTISEMLDGGCDLLETLIVHL